MDVSILLREYAVYVVLTLVFASIVGFTVWHANNIMHVTYLAYIKTTFEPWGYGYVNGSETRIYLTNLGDSPYIAKIFLKDKLATSINDPVEQGDVKEVLINEKYFGPVTILACHYKHRDACKLFTFEIANLTKLLEIAKNLTSTNVLSSSNLSNILVGWYNPVEETVPGYVNLLIGISPSSSRGFAKITVRYPNGKVEKYLLYTLGSEELEPKFKDEKRYRAVISKYIVTTVTPNVINNLMRKYYGEGWRYHRLDYPCGHCDSEDCLHNDLTRCKAFAYVNGRVECFSNIVQGVLELNNIPAGTNITIQVSEPLIACRPRIVTEGCIFGHCLIDLSCIKVPNPEWHFYAFISNIFGKIDNTTTITFTVNKSGWISIVYAPEMQLIPIHIKVKTLSTGLVSPNGRVVGDVEINVEGTWYKVTGIHFGKTLTLKLPINYAVRISTVSNVEVGKCEKCGCCWQCKYSSYSYVKTRILDPWGKVKKEINNNVIELVITQEMYDNTVEVLYKHEKSWTTGSCCSCEYEKGKEGEKPPKPPRIRTFEVYGIGGGIPIHKEEGSIIELCTNEWTIEVKYADKNDNKRYDPGEPIVGMSIKSKEEVFVGVVVTG